MKYLFTLVFLFACLSEIKAQCSLKPSYTISGGISVQDANFEKLYENLGENNNGDLTRGYTRIQGRFSKITKVNSTLIIWQLQVIINSNRNTDLVPRRLDFHFTNGTALTLNAATFDIREGIRVCRFEVSDSELALLKNPIQKVDIIDTRAERMYSGTKDFGLYSRVLSEQIGCLE
jgi:hypothetical protein